MQLTFSRLYVIFNLLILFKKWFCHLCHDDRKAPQSNIVDKGNGSNINPDQIKCVSCKRKVNKAEYISNGGKCANQFHGDCVLSEEEKEKYCIQRSNDMWFCKNCVLFLQGGIKWGEMIGFDEISSKLDAMYDEIICWRLNLFNVVTQRKGRERVH